MRRIAAFFALLYTLASVGVFMALFARGEYMAAGICAIGLGVILVGAGIVWLAAFDGKWR